MISEVFSQPKQSWDSVAQGKSHCQVSASRASNVDAGNIQENRAESFPLHGFFLHFVTPGRTLSLNMLQRSLGLGELSVLELVVRFCSVNEPSGIAVVSPWITLISCSTPEET